MTRPLPNWHSAHAEHLTRGERAADRLRNGIGSWPFIGGFVVFMIARAMQLDLLRELRRDVPSIAARDEGPGR